MLESGDSHLLSLVIVFVCILTICIYPIPLIVAIVRKQPNRLAIGALNLLLGWSLIGWVGALIWALTRPTIVPQYVATQHPIASSPEMPGLGPTSLTAQVQASSPRWSLRQWVGLAFLLIFSVTALLTLSHIVKGQLSPHNPMVIGKTTKDSDEIIGRLHGKLETLCQPQQVVPLNWPGADYETVVFACDELAGTTDPANTSDDYEYPRYILALRAKRFGQSRMLALDSTHDKYDRVTLGRIGHYDALFAQSFGTGSGSFQGTTMIIWDDSNSSPRAVDVDGITGGALQKIIPSGVGIRDSIFPSWDGANKLTFAADLMRDSDAHCCPTGGSFTLDYITGDGGRTWRLVSRHLTPGSTGEEKP